MSGIGEKGEGWGWSWYMNDPRDMHDDYKQAMHDRDKFQREAAYWREQAEAMRESCGYAHLAPCWEAP